MKTVYVNKNKKDRAEAIVAMLTGDKVPSDSNEEALAQRYGKLAGEEKVDLKKDGVEWAYLKLGGLMRTEEEEKKAKEKKVAIQKKGKKDSMGLK